MKLCNPMLFCVVYRCQRADVRAGAQTPMHGGRSYLSLDNLLAPPAKDMIDNIGEESHDDGEMRHPNPRSFPMRKTGIQQFERKLQMRIIRQQRYLEVIRILALGLFANYEQGLVADEDVAWLHKHDRIVNPPAAGSLANTKHTSSCPAAN